MTAEAAVEHFFRLFRGRSDVRWSWLTKRPIYGPVVKKHFERHLMSADPANWIGVYPLLVEGLCSWGCVDIDKTDDSTIAHNLRGALNYKGIPAWIERTDNGFHVWVFPEDPPGWVSAETMRRALYAACAAIGYEPKEVNPKQSAAKKYGNLVRLPWNGILAGVKHRYFISPAEAHVIDPTSVVQVMDEERAPTAALEAIAALWTPPERNAIALEDIPPLSKHLTDKMQGRAYKIWKGGPLDGSDRSGTMVRLAHQLAADGLTPEEAFTVLQGAWWQKYRGRNDEELQIQNIVERAFS